MKVSHIQPRQQKLKNRTNQLESDQKPIRSNFSRNQVGFSLWSPFFKKFQPNRGGIHFLKINPNLTHNLTSSHFSIPLPLPILQLPLPRRWLCEVCFSLTLCSLYINPNNYQLFFLVEFDIIHPSISQVRVCVLSSLI